MDLLKNRIPRNESHIEIAVRIRRRVWIEGIRCPGHLPVFRVYRKKGSPKSPTQSNLISFIRGGERARFPSNYTPCYDRYNYKHIRTVFIFHGLS